MNVLDRIDEIEKQLKDVKQQVTLEPSEDVKYKKLILAILYHLTLDEHIGDVKGTISTVVDKLDVPFEFNGTNDLQERLREYGIGYTGVGEDDGITLYNLTDQNSNE